MPGDRDAGVDPEWLERELATYIRLQRNQYRLLGRPFSATENATFEPFLDLFHLSQVRLVELPDTESVKEPAFYAELRALGMGQLPVFALMQAVTFEDVIVASSPPDLETVFHELVHVTQYRLLGLKRFAALYVRGFLEAGGYDDIPLEVQARRLAEQFCRGESSDLELEVAAWIREQLG